MTTLSGDGLTPVRRMKLIALLLLFLAAALYCLATALEARHPAWGYAAAFAEAAIVRTTADWYAVTALFRHPLGLPIPHTAIIPRNKAGVGRKLSDFICLHFLATPQVLAPTVPATCVPWAWQSVLLPSPVGLVPQVAGPPKVGCAVLFMKASCDMACARRHGSAGSRAASGKRRSR